MTEDLARELEEAMTMPARLPERSAPSRERVVL